MEAVVCTRPEYRWPLLSLLLIVVPFSVVSRWWNGERTIDLAQTLIVHGTSFCVEPRRSCPRRPIALHGTQPWDITLAPKKLIRTRRASKGSASEPLLARRVSMCKDAK